jgi:hypothetical protein
MSEEATEATGVPIKIKLDDLSLYYRRVALERLGAVFQLEPGTFPLEWRALWGDPDHDHEEGPMALADLIPAVEGAMGVREILSGPS